MQTNDDTHPTPTHPKGATDRAARLRARVRAALEAGDPTGSWRRVAELLDHADRARELAAEQLELGEKLLDEIVS